MLTMKKNYYLQLYDNYSLAFDSQHAISQFSLTD